MSSDNFSTEQIIELRKLLGKYIKDARSRSRHKVCLLCGREGGFCNSHTIPQFCLENIAWNGKLYSMHTLLNTQLLSSDSGVNSSGTFHIICRDCDGRVFQDYENAEAFEAAPTEKVLNQIALKTAMRDIYKHEAEIEMYEAVKLMAAERLEGFSQVVDVMMNSQIDARKRDVEECYEIFDRAKDCLSDGNSRFRTISCDILNYIAPIAFQGMVALVTGADGEVINDNFNYEDSYRVEYLHIAVFPLKRTTAVILFLDAESTRYEKFESFITGLEQEKRLEIINRIIFLYTEDYYLSKQLDEGVLRRLEEPARSMQDMFSVNPRRTLRKAVRDYSLKREIRMPNLLSEEYAVEAE